MADSILQDRYTWGTGLKSLQNMPSERKPVQFVEAGAQLTLRERVWFSLVR